MNDNQQLSSTTECCRNLWFNLDKYFLLLHPSLVFLYNHYVLETHVSPLQKQLVFLSIYIFRAPTATRRGGVLVSKREYGVLLLLLTIRRVQCGVCVCVPVFSSFSSSPNLPFQYFSPLYNLFLKYGDQKKKTENKSFLANFLPVFLFHFLAFIPLSVVSTSFLFYMKQVNHLCFVFVSLSFVAN